MNDRFEGIYKETHSAGLEKRIIYVDKKTGVNDLFSRASQEAYGIVSAKVKNGGIVL